VIRLAIAFDAQAFLRVDLHRNELLHKSTRIAP